MGNERAATDFGAEVSKLMPMIMRTFARQEKSFLSQGDISLPQMVMLDILRDNGTSRMKELAAALNCSMSGVTALADKLISIGFIKREHSTLDRRVVNVTITAKGRTAIDRIDKQRVALTSRLFAPLSAEEQKTYLSILRKIMNGLKHGMAS